ncbi:MAG: ABC transporter ATP-binding protein [Clostridia bacterium]|nr:ABC transporter ATP-binding protein [Clostridia bacterium]
MKKVAKKQNENLLTTTLEVKALCKKYSARANYAIKDISFSCEKGQIVGLLGANGAGKSTSLKCITGMIPLTEGEIFIGGKNISKNPIDAKRHFSFVTDNHATFVKMTGFQYLSFMADVYKVSKKDRQARYLELEKVFQLGDAVKKLISNYSHGMKQKICMMASLIHEPDLWILDEPMVGLDPRTQNAVINFMHAYAKKGKTILFSSHNLDVVRRVCDRVVIINKGNLVADLVIDDQMRNDHSIIESYYFGDDEEALKEAMMADQAFEEEVVEEEIQEEAVEEVKSNIRVISRKQANKVPNPPRFHMQRGEGKK